MMVHVRKNGFISTALLHFYPLSFLSFFHFIILIISIVCYVQIFINKYDV